MIYKLNDLDDKIKKYIIKKYNQDHSIKDIEKELNISRNTIISLFSKEDVVYLKSDCSSFELNKNKILIISDTHIGSKKDNLKYIDLAYETGLKNNVGACLHLGDIIQGEYDKTNKSIDYQLDILENKYPNISEFNTYLLLGNHDYNVFEAIKEYKEILESRKDIITLGYKKVYFNWCNYLYAMEHKVKQLSDEMLLEDVALSFIGHGHELKLKSQSKLKVPTLSDDIINQTNGAYPAFLIAQLLDNHLSVDVYNFKKDEAKIKRKKYFENLLIESYKVK